MNIIASLNFTAIHLILLLRKVVVFNLNLNLLDRFENGDHMAGIRFVICSENCLHFTIVVNSKRPGCIRLPYRSIVNPLIKIFDFITKDIIH